MLKKLFIPLIFISVIITFGTAIFSLENSSFIREEYYIVASGTINQQVLYYYKFDVGQYIRNLTAITLQSLNNITPKIPEGSFGLDIGHNFNLLIQWLAYYGSLITWPLRLLATAYVNILALLGMNLTNNPTGFGKWIMDWVYIYK